MFTQKQRLAVQKAIQYLDSVPDEAKTILETIEPKTVSDASQIVSLVFALAYRKGDMISGLWGQNLETKRNELTAELIDLLSEYA